MGSYDDEKKGGIFPTHTGPHIGTSKARGMLDNIGGSAGAIRTQQWIQPDGSTTRLKTKDGMPEFITEGGGKETLNEVAKFVTGPADSYVWRGWPTAPIAPTQVVKDKDITKTPGTLTWYPNAVLTPAEKGIGTQPVFPSAVTWMGPGFRHGRHEKYPTGGIATWHTSFVENDETGFSNYIWLSPEVFVIAPANVFSVGIRAKSTLTPEMALYVITTTGDVYATTDKWYSYVMANDIAYKVVDKKLKNKPLSMTLVSSIVLPDGFGYVQVPFINQECTKAAVLAYKLVDGYVDHGGFVPQGDELVLYEADLDTGALVEITKSTLSYTERSNSLRHTLLAADYKNNELVWLYADEFFSDGRIDGYGRAGAVGTIGGTGSETTVDSYTYVFLGTTVIEECLELDSNITYKQFSQEIPQDVFESKVFHSKLGLLWEQSRGDHGKRSVFTAALTAHNIDYRLRRSVDGGATWENTPMPGTAAWAASYMTAWSGEMDITWSATYDWFAVVTPEYRDPSNPVSSFGAAITVLDADLRQDSWVFCFRCFSLQNITAAMSGTAHTDSGEGYSNATNSGSQTATFKYVFESQIKAVVVGVEYNFPSNKVEYSCGKTITYDMYAGLPGWQNYSAKIAIPASPDRTPTWSGDLDYGIFTSFYTTGGIDLNPVLCHLAVSNPVGRTIDGADKATAYFDFRRESVFSLPVVTKEFARLSDTGSTSAPYSGVEYSLQRPVFFPNHVVSVTKDS